jgi:hypothetical protein
MSWINRSVLSPWQRDMDRAPHFCDQAVASRGQVVFDDGKLGNCLAEQSGWFQMESPGITITRLPHEDEEWRTLEWRILVRTSNSEFCAALDVYVHSDKLAELGRQLSAFPTSVDAEVRLEIGDRQDPWAYHLLLRTFLYDRAGHAAVEVRMDNRRKDYRHAAAHFSIPCEVASLNRLGQSLFAWIRQPDEPLAWTPTTS